MAKFRNILPLHTWETGGGCKALGAQHDIGGRYVLLTQGEDPIAPELTADVREPTVIGVYDDRTSLEVLAITVPGGICGLQEWVGRFDPAYMRNELGDGLCSSALDIAGRAAWLAATMAYAAVEAVNDEPPEDTRRFARVWGEGYDSAPDIVGVDEFNGENGYDEQQMAKVQTLNVRESADLSDPSGIHLVTRIV